jgi:hypothetical protein
MAPKAELVTKEPTMPWSGSVTGRQLLRFTCARHPGAALAVFVPTANSAVRSARSTRRARATAAPARMAAMLTCRTG